MLVETLTYKDFDIEIYQDECPQNPYDEWDMFGKVVCFHRNYIIGEKHNYSDYTDLLYDVLTNVNTCNTLFPCIHDDQYDLSEREFIEKYEKHFYKYFIVLPVYIYNHSGITINTTGFQCPWDSGQIGIIYISKEDVRKEWKVTRISSKLQSKIIQQLRNTIEVYDNYLTGNVYGYDIPVVEDSCWGFYGYEWDKNGLLEYAHNAIDCYIEHERKRKQDTVKTFIKNHVPLEIRQIKLV